MKGFWLLNFWFLIGICNANILSDSVERLEKKNQSEYPIIAPPEQTAKEHEDVTIDCIHTGKVHWVRKNGLPLPKEAKEFRGRLSIVGIKSTASGYYVCIPEDGSPSKEAHIKVIKTKKAHKYATPTKLSTSGLKQTFEQTTSVPTFISSGFTQAPVFAQTNTPVTANPFLQGFCNGTHCESTSFESFFDCANGQKISKLLVCNQHNDCEDGSDEAKCSPWPPKITLLPEQKVKVFCGDEDRSKAGILVLECIGVGHPIPLIKWKKYEGHVPSKCIQTSQGGRGRLECPDFQQTDQGAYSCVAENYLKSAQSQPKSVAKCSNAINCKGFKVINEEQIEHCLECFCSGKTSQCQNIKSITTVHKFPFPETKTEVFAENDGDIVFVPSKNKLSPNNKIRESAKEVTYCSLSEEELKATSFLKSFGRNLIIPRFKGKSNFLTKAPDLIIQGNNLSLIYTFNKISPASENSSGVAVRFWPGNWHYIDKSVANRKDIMKVLSNVDSLLLRCEYVQGDILNLSKTATISLESSAITNNTNVVSYVEKCNCPVGFDGLSCESCAEGYTKKADGSDFFCEKTYVPPKVCKPGYVGANCTDCDEYKGYVKQGNECVKFTCDPIGSISASPNSSGKCTCKEGVTGDFCEKCKLDHFYLQKGKGCSKCWCSGITDQCSSSKLYRTVISKTPYGGYNSSDGRNFWLLPSEFSGNLLSSYGGYLNYTMTYKPGIPKEITYLTVEFLSADDDTFVYTHSTLDKSTHTKEKSWSVPITEQNWKKRDKSSINRGEFLSFLSKIKAIYIESPYHLSSGQANLTSTRMSSATLYGDVDSEPAFEVEQCNCPVGYSGLSCESCSEGYYKKRNGSITQCLKCNCTYCDPEFGCPDCPEMTYRQNSEDRQMPVCKPCPCNNNALGCSKDDYNQIICRCKPGYTGMHCEKKIINVTDHDLTLRISPRRIRNKRVGSAIMFNCSYISAEEMILSAQKTFGKNYPDSLLNPHINSENVTTINNKIVKNFKVVLEDGLEFLECFLHDGQGRLAGHIRAVVEDLITIIKPLKITNCYSTLIDVKESESKDLICEATGSPPPMITWYKAIENKTAEKVDTVDGVHSIESATLDQNGTIYTCIAENSEGDKATCSMALIVRKKCEIVTISPSEVREEEGRNISLLCKTSAKSNVTWSRINYPLPSKSSVENGYLKIQNAVATDSGTYICTAVGQNNNTINNTAIVIVEEKKIPPSVVIPDNDKVLQVGDNFEVKCVGYGNPVPVIKWSKLNGALEKNVIVRGNMLAINKAMAQNAGIYVCEGVSDLGNSTGYIAFEVRQKIIPPTVTVSHQSIKAHDGEEVTLTCVATGYPRPKVTWFSIGINDTNFSRKQHDWESGNSLAAVNETLIFKVTQDMDGKNVVCAAEVENATAQTITKITVLQSRGSTNERVEFAKLGSYFVLRCDSIHDNVTWTKLGGLMGDECKALNDLMFESVQVQHNGTYTCKTQSNFVQIIHLMVLGFVPKFNQAFRSYMVLPVHVKSAGEIRIELSFNPTKENGLILHRENHMLDLYLKAGRIHLGIYSKEGDFFDIVVKEFVEVRKWHLLIVSINQHYVDITIYDEKAKIYGRKTESLRDFKIHIGPGKETFFIGRTISGNRMRHPHAVFFSHFDSFDGCISRLRINHHEVDFVKESSYSEKVHLCNKCSEEPNVCQGKGKCLDAPTQYGFICVCPDDNDSKKSTCPAGCSGKGCETQLDLCKLLVPCKSKVVHKCTNKMYRLQCDCAYGYSGNTCERVVEHSFCAKNIGYVRLPNLFKRHLLNIPEVIKMAFTLDDEDGMLLWQGDQFNHLSISVEDGKLKYIYQNQKSPLAITTTNILPIEKRIDLQITRANNTVSLELTVNDETKTQETYKNFTRFTTNRVFGDIYLGNVPSNLQHRYSGLNGCIHYIAFGDKPKIDLRERELERMDVYLPQNRQLEQDSDEDDLNETNEVY